MDQLEILKDGKAEIQFWLDALSNPNLEKKSITLINQSLQSELNQYLNPVNLVYFQYKQASNE